jgi:hypothetical protein
LIENAIKPIVETSDIKTSKIQPDQAQLVYNNSIESTKYGYICICGGADHKDKM